MRPERVFHGLDGATYVMKRAASGGLLHHRVLMECRAPGGIPSKESNKTEGCVLRHAQNLAEQEKESVRYSQEWRKRVWQNLATIGALLVLGVAGIVVADGVGLVPDGSRAHPVSNSGTGSMPVTGATAARVVTKHEDSDGSRGAARGDVLDRIRAVRSPELEREILEIARTSVAVAAGGQQVCDQDGDRRLDLANSVLAAPAGVFVTLILDGRVRGCMGTVYPVEASLADEIASAARMAATSDPRRPPVSPEEVPELAFCVSVVGRLRREKPESGVDPQREGVIVRANGRSGIILPGEARTAAYEIAWAKREAGIGPGDHFELYVFETERFGKALPLRR
ncbi:MAG: AMMECR1 domain-containing protein [Bacillota bacterium]